MKKITPYILAFLATASLQVSAATFDFVRYADGTASNPANNERGYSNSSPFSVSEGGITLKTYAYEWNKTERKWNDAYAYLDHGNAGLGVCKQLNNSNQCNPSSDDNVTFRETIVLSFDQAVSLDEVSFTNGGHHKRFKGKFMLTSYLGGAWSNWTSHSLTSLFMSNLVGEKFAFYNPMKDSDWNKKKQFYISAVNVSAVPIPAALWLFGSAILGLAAIRKNNAVSGAVT